MNKEEIEDILEELHLVRPEILKPKAKKLFEAIMSIADERDELQQENQKYKEVIDKAIEELMNIPINASYSEIVEYPRKAYRALKEVK